MSEVALAREISIKKNLLRVPHPCRTCPLEGCEKIKPTLTRGARILVLYKEPENEGAARQRQHLSKNGMRVLSHFMSKNGLDKSDVAFHNVIRCHFVRDETEAVIKKEIAASCREYMLRVIDQVKPEVIIPLGAETASILMGRGVQIMKARGIAKFVTDYNAHVFPMIDPLFVALYPQNEGIFDADCKILSRLMNNGFDQKLASDNASGHYERVKDLQFLIDQNPEVVSLDVETEGLRWIERDKRLLTIQVSTEEGTGYLISWDHPDDPAPKRLKNKLRRQLKELLCRPEVSVTGHNVKFDAMWIWTRLGLRVRIMEDTLVMLASIDENLRSKDLATVVKMYVPEMGGYSDWFDSHYDKSKMAEVPLDDIVSYGCGDVDAALRLRNVILGIMADDPAQENNYYTVSMPGLNSFMPMELQGLDVDENALDSLQENLQAHVDDLHATLVRDMPRKVVRDHFRAGKKISLTRPELIRDILFDHPDGFCLEPKMFTKGTSKLPEHLRVPTTSSKDHLPFFFDECPYTEVLAEWMKMNRLLETNIKKFREHYIYEGSIHPIYQLHVAVTGRSASRDPNGQNFPKRGRFAKLYRGIFKAPPGYALLQCDLSQAELRIVAEMAQEPTMLEIYQTGGDIHRRTALIVAGISEAEYQSLEADERDLLRFKAKAVNFGFIYGMGWRKFIVYAKTQYGVEFSENDAKRIRKQFFQTYSGLTAWHQAVREFAREYGYVRSFSGRVRHLPAIRSVEEYIRQEAERQAINSPVQEFASTLGVRANAEIDQEIDPELLTPNGFVHDALLALVRLEHVEWGAKVLKEYMEGVDIEGLWGYKMSIPIVADVSFGTHAGKQYEMSGLDLDEDFDFSTIEDMDIELPEQVVPENYGRIEIEEHLVTLVA